MLWVRILFRCWCTRYNITWYKICQWLVAGQWFSPYTPVSSTNKTDRHDITEILLKVTSNIITLTLTPNIVLMYIHIYHNVTNFKIWKGQKNYFAFYIFEMMIKLPWHLHITLYHIFKSLHLAAKNMSKFWTLLQIIHYIYMEYSLRKYVSVTYQMYKRHKITK